MSLFRLNEYEIVLILEAKHTNEVEAQRSEKLPVKQKCQSLFSDSAESIVFVFVLKLKVNTDLQQLLTYN